MKTSRFAVLLILSISLSACATGKSQRGVASSDMPPGAMGLPLPPSQGSNGPPPGALGLPMHPPSGGIHPVMGMPLSPDHACRRAAGQSAIHAALAGIEHSQDCTLETLEVVTENKAYTATVECGDTGTFNFTVRTKPTAKGCQAKTAKPAKAD